MASKFKRPVEVQVRITPGQPAFVIVGLPDKADEQALRDEFANLTAVA